jgi:RNA methyltransferase, TrmH family
MTTETLTSANNPLLKSVRRAVARGELTDGGACVAEGLHLLEEALRSGCRIDAVLLAADIRLDVPLAGKVRVHSVPRTVFNSLASTEATQGVISLVRPPSWTMEQIAGAHPLVVVLDGIQEPGNAGAIVRAAEAFRASGVLFLKGTVNAYNPKSVRASAGSLFRVPAVHGVTDEAFRAFAHDRSLAVFVTAPGAALSIHGVDLRTPCAIVIGSEARGVRPEIARDAAAVSIPTRGVESLNAAVAAGVILYEAQRQRSAS